MFQMSAHPEYGGILAIENNWAVAILLKHLVVLIMMAASAYMTWGILPALSRLALIKAAGKVVDEKTEVRLRQKEARLIWANLILSFVVLLLTAAARAG
jgi:1,4-dihydroxy-2-naphthoate octaprenyltransferase